MADSTTTCGSRRRRRPRRPWPPDGVLHLAGPAPTRLNTLSSRDGEEFGGKRTWPARSLRQETETPAAARPRPRPPDRVLSPALAWLGEDLHLGWTGTDRRLNVEPGPGQEGEQGHEILDETSPHGPAGGPGCRDGAGLDGHRPPPQPGDRRGRWGSSWRLDETSDHAPAVGAAGGELALAWTAPTATSTCCGPATAPGAPGAAGREELRRPALGTVDERWSWPGRDPTAATS